jgi:hypothetical protein
VKVQSGEWNSRIILVATVEAGTSSSGSRSAKAKQCNLRNIKNIKLKL